MKKFVFMAVMASVLSVFAQENNADIQVINVASITYAELEAILDEENESMILEFSAGMMIPLKFFLKEEKEIGHVKIERTFYIRSTEEDLLFSLDLTEWTALDNLFGEEDTEEDLL